MGFALARWASFCGGLTDRKHVLERPQALRQDLGCGAHNRWLPWARSGPSVAREEGAADQ